MAFLSAPPRVTKRSRSTLPVTCSHRDDPNPSNLPPLFSAVVAATISLPLITSEHSGPQPLYRKLAPAAATVAVATSLLLRRRQKSSRTIVPKQSPDAGNTEAPTQGERLENARNTSTTNSSIYERSRQDWAFSETQFEGSSAETQRGASRSTPNSKDSYPNSGTHNRTRGELNDKKAAGEQRAVGMDTSSLFSHMRAEFLSEASTEQEELTPQRNSSLHDQEDRHERLVRPLAADQFGEGSGSHLSKLKHPSSVSAADVLRWFVRAPVFILSEIVVPIAQVSSIMWYDCKQWILGPRNQEKIYFIDDVQASVNEFNSFENNSEAAWEWDNLDVELTDEEKLLKDIQNNVRNVFGHAYGTVRRFLK